MRKKTMTFAPGLRFSSFRLTISRRLALLVGAAALLMLCGFAVQLSTIRDTLLFERRTAIRNEVQTAVSIARAFAAEAAAGRRCASCHTDNFAGTKAVARIASQREEYLNKALHDYKSSIRSGGGQAAMAEVAYPLSEEEITALAHYLAHL